VLDFSVTFFITIVNITFLYLVLKKILFKPVTKFMEDRSNKIQKDIDMAKSANSRAEAREAEFLEKLSKAKEEGQKVIQAAREKAEQEYAAIIAEAKEQAAKIIEASRHELAEDRRSAEIYLQKETANFSIQAASKIIEENLDSEKNRKLVEKFLETVGVA
jgi:F-type H+-transporting ATPase subunit b